MATENNVSEEIIQIGKLVFYRNTLLFESTAYQVSNICSIRTLDKSYVVKNEFPFGAIILLVMGGAILLYGLSEFKGGATLVVGGIGVLILMGAVSVLKEYEAETSHKNFVLEIELNSGRKTYFASSDTNFINRVANSLLQAMARGINNEEKLVLNSINLSLAIADIYEDIF